MLTHTSVPSECEIDCLISSDLLKCWHAVSGVSIYDSNYTIHCKLRHYRTIHHTTLLYKIDIDCAHTHTQKNDVKMVLLSINTYTGGSVRCECRYNMTAKTRSIFYEIVTGIK